MNSNPIPQSEPIKVLMMPDFRRDNPYQALLAQALEQKGAKIYFWGYYLRYFPIFRAIKSQKESIKLIHLHWIDFYIQEEQNKLDKFLISTRFLFDVLLVRLLGVKIVWTVHNQVSHDTKFPELEQWVRTWLSRFVNRLIFHHQSALDCLAQQYQLQPGKAAVIDAGHYRTVYHPPIDLTEARKQLGLPLTGRLYLSLGFLKPYKGIEKLLKVWRTYRTELTGDTLLIAGRPINEAYGQSLKSQVADLDDVILHLEFVEPSQIHLFFSAANIVVLPFEKILTSGSVVLAMSYDKPVIAPRLPGVAETLGEADSLLYDPEDEKGLLKAFQKSTEIDLHSLSELVVQECDRLDWETVADKTLNVYRSVLNLNS